jgi:hypothetical protein
LSDVRDLTQRARSESRRTLEPVDEVPRHTPSTHDRRLAGPLTLRAVAGLTARS